MRAQVSKTNKQSGWFLLCTGWRAGRGLNMQSGPVGLPTLCMGCSPTGRPTPIIDMEWKFQTHSCSKYVFFCAKLHVLLQQVMADQILKIDPGYALTKYISSYKSLVLNVYRIQKLSQLLPVAVPVL